MDNIWLNAHAVPATDLVTVNVIVVVTIIMFVANYFQLSKSYYWPLMMVGLALSVLLCFLTKTPSNLSYYFGLGEKPAGWRGE